MRVAGREKHGDFLTLREAFSIWVTLFRFLSVGYLMMLAKERLRGGDRVRKNGVRGKIWEGKPDEGAVLSQRRCGLDSTPQKCLEREGTKEVRTIQTSHVMLNYYYFKILNIARVKL